eukprot:TRINITY_DN24251_c0_g1_i1.p1 TRINITY_DN24251_c0_g1~~TRINITY_DN24251_c0_g1_i1.p1  ORF type:complete len:424 (+),score=11.93 TRINITY_DN24251_c0_g1_i1:30-1274(+)
MNSPLVTQTQKRSNEQNEIFLNRRKVAEYRIWGQGLMGSLRLCIQVTGTVWAEIWPQVVVMLVLTLGAASVNLAYSWDVSLIGHQIVLVPMSFLLVFRCSNSYQRYWDGRTLLGLLVFHSRELVCKAASFAPERHEKFVTDIKRYTICAVMAINMTVSQHWQKIEQDREDRKTGKKGTWRWEIENLKDHLTQEEYDDLRDIPKSHPLVMFLWIRHEIQQACQSKVLTPFQGFEMSANVGELQQVWNGMSKITSTPLPYPWVHLSRLILWMFLLTMIPPAVSQLGFNSAPFLLVSSFLFFGLVQIGNEMEDPFGSDINDFDLASFETSVIDDVAMITTHRIRQHTRAKSKTVVPRQDEIMKESFLEETLPRDPVVPSSPHSLSNYTLRPCGSDRFQEAPIDSAYSSAMYELKSFS